MGGLDERGGRVGWLREGIKEVVRWLGGGWVGWLDGGWGNGGWGNGKWEMGRLDERGGEDWLDGKWGGWLREGIMEMVRWLDGRRRREGWKIMHGGW